MEAWIATATVIFFAGLLEVAWAIGLKCSDGFSRPLPASVYVCMMLSVGLLGVAMRVIPVGTAYAVWTGIGALGTALAGMALFGESRDPWRIVFLVIILIGIIGLGVRETMLEDVPTERTDAKLGAFGCWLCKILC